MATISERPESRSFTLGLQAVRELIYNIVDAADDAAAQTILASTAPATYGGLTLDSINADPIGGGLWKGYARYATIASDDEYTFDTGGGTQRITQSLATIASYAPSGLTAPDFQGAIGVSDDRVEGVDIPVPSFQFTETHRFADASVGSAYKLTLFYLTGCMNDASFKGLAAGECLFLGATGSKRGDEDWSITFRFAGSPNVTGRTIGSITGIAKLGWDYLWVRYADFADSFSYSLVKRPVAAYVERVSAVADFSTLSIGT